LRRLGTDWIDLYQVHSFDALVPPEETLRALDDLVRAGKIRYIGCSNFAGWQLAKALGISRLEGLSAYAGQQIQYSLVARSVEEELLPCGVHRAAF
jgi:aryl-alcohol dehydrogenase-like predicted oxidoreductase